MKKKNRKIVDAIVAIMCVISIVYAGWLFSIGWKQKEYCGTIKSVPEPVIVTGKNSYAERYVVMNFNNGRTKAIKVDADTYYRAAVGAGMCFNLQITRMEEEKAPNPWYMTLSMTVLILAIFYVLLFRY